MISLLGNIEQMAKKNVTRGVKQSARESKPTQEHPSLNFRAIGAALGVSAQAGSFAVRNTPGVSKATRARVLAYLDKLGYRPQPALSALMREVRLHPSKRTVMKMAFINSWNEPFAKAAAEPLRNFYFGALEEAEKMGYVVEVFDGGQTSEEQNRLERKLEFSGVDGLLVFPTLSTKGVIKLEWDKFSAIEIGQPIQDAPLTLITPDHFGNTTLLCRRLLDYKFKRIGFVQDLDVHDRVGGNYLGAFLAAAWPEARKRFVEPLMGYDLKPGDIIQYVKSKRCDVLIVGPHFDVNWLLSAGISVPGDLSIVGYSLYAAECEAGIAGIDEQWKQVGAIAAEHLARRIQTHTRGLPKVREVVHVPGQWVEGNLFAPK